MVAEDDVDTEPFGKRSDARLEMDAGAAGEKRS